MTAPLSPAYYDRWNADEQARIDEDIEKYRKADATVALDRLINDEWRTRLTVTADASGAVRFRGAYRLSWRDASGALREATANL